MPSSPLLGKVPALLLAPLVLLALAACGGSRTHPAGPPTAATLTPKQLSAAGLKLRQAGSLRFDIVLNEVALGQKVEASGSGVEQIKGPRLAMTMDMNGAGQRIHMQMRELGDVYYINSPQLSSVPGAKPWIRTTSQQTNGINVSQAAGADPSSYANVLEAAASSFRRVGQTTVHGTPVALYRGRLSLAKIVAASRKDPALKSAFSPQTLQSLKSSGIGDIAVEVGIDGSGTLRLFKESLKVGGLVSLDVRMQMYGFGVPVSVSAPPKAQTMSMQALTQLSGGKQP